MAPSVQIVLLLAGAASLLFIDLILTTALAAAALLSPVALRRMANESDERLRFIEKLRLAPSRHGMAATLGSRLSLLAAVLLVALAAGVAQLGPAAAIGVVAVAVAGVLLVEMLVAPALARRNPRNALRFTVFSLTLALRLLYPIVGLLHGVHTRIGAVDTLTEEEREEEQEEAVEALIEVGEREGLLEAKESEMMRGIVDLDETPVREIMTPRTDIVGIPADTLVSEARSTFLAAGHSRLPVFRGSIDHVIGVLHSRDLFRAWEERCDDRAVSAYVRSASFVPESLSAASLLTEMRQNTHLSMVVDEYGGIAGLVTLEDLLEEIVGDIRDEHDTEEDLVVQQPDGSFLVHAGTHVKELETLFDIDFEEREFDTVGGLVVFGFGRVPSAGEVLETHGLRVEVLQAERRRVHRVRIRRIDREADVQASR